MKSFFLLTQYTIYDNVKLSSHEVYFTSKGGVKLKNNVRKLRTKINMTQVELAKLVHVSSRTIISIETEKYNPSLILAYRIAEIFNVSLEDLYCLKENKALEDQQNE